MVCPKCQRVIPNGSVLCPSCGADLKPSIKKEKKKKGCLTAFTIVITVFLTLLFVIIISVDDESSTDNGNVTTTSSGKIETTQSKNDTAKLIFEDDYIKASFVKVFSDPVVDASVEGVAYMQLHVENKSNQTVTVALSKAAINGMTTTFGSGVPMTLLPGNASEQPFILFTKNTGVNNADDIEKLQFSFHLFDENYSTIEETKTIEVKVK